MSGSTTEKQSFVEKVMDKLHLGSQDKETEVTHAAQTSSVPVVPVIPVVGGTESLHTGGEALATEHVARAHESHAHDSRDLNRDAHVSTGEKLKSAVTGEHAYDSREASEEARLRLHEEQLAVSKRAVNAGEVGIQKHVETEHVSQTIPVKHEEVTVERRPLSGVPDASAHIGAKDEVVRVPLYREELVTEKRVVPTEEVIVRKNEAVDHQTVTDTLRSEKVDMQTGATHSSATAHTHDVRDTDHDGNVSMSEKIKAAAGLNKA